jgi:hypothetical protein
MLRADNGVVEVFQRGLEYSLRVPIAWLVVQPQPTRKDQLSILVGQGNPPGRVLFGASVAVNPRACRHVRMQVTDGPDVHAFFAKVAVLADRSVES